MQNLVVDWLDRRITEMLGAPRMWGSLEAVEMQVLQLLELRAMALRPAVESENPRQVVDAYLAFLRVRFPKGPPEPLFRLVGNLEGTAGVPPQFVETLRGFQAAMSRMLLVENPFEHSELAIKLTFDRGLAPSTSAFTGYYEEFRRAARAVVRKRVSTGRAKKEIERATDFTLVDATVTPPNGAPAEVLLRLGAGNGQRDFDAEETVRDALSSMLTLGEWAATTAAVGDLRVDDVERRTQTAVQLLRLLPSRGVKTVAIGGKLVVRSKPVELRPDHEKRLLEVVGADASPEAFDETGEVRAVDLDRGLLVLGKGEGGRVNCYVRPELVGSVTEVGVRARVQGRRYRPLSQRQFVLADSIEVQRDTSED